MPLTTFTTFFLGSVEGSTYPDTACDTRSRGLQPASSVFSTQNQHLHLLSLLVGCAVSPTPQKMTSICLSLSCVCFSPSLHPSYEWVCRFYIYLLKELFCCSVSPKREVICHSALCLSNFQVLVFIGPLLMSITFSVIRTFFSFSRYVKGPVNRVFDSGEK